MMQWQIKPSADTERFFHILFNSSASTWDKPDNSRAPLGRRSPAGAKFGDSRQSLQTYSRTAMVLIVGLLIGGSGSPVSASPCSVEIAQLESALKALPDPTARQSTDATLHRQPTPESLARARKEAAAHEQQHRDALARARAADARGDRDACRKALSEARHRLAPR